VVEQRIKPDSGVFTINFAEIWQYRELLYFFTWRDLKVRYKQTVIGVLWALFQPFITMVVFSVFFGNFSKMPSEGIPYPIFVYIGLLFWQLFSSSLSDVSNCLISNQSIVTKVYFPRLILPFSYLLTNFIDFGISWLILGGLMVYFQYLPKIGGFLILPLLIMIVFMTATGLGLFMASINVRYRDVRYALPFFIQLLLFVTPVIYPVGILNNYSWVMAFNPLSGVISAARASFLGTLPISWGYLLVSFFVALAWFAFGIVSFKKTETYFADIV